MKTRTPPAARILLSLAAACALCGCAALNSVQSFLGKDSRFRPVLLVLPVTCENNKIGEDITLGLIGNIGGGAEVLDVKKFEVYLTSRAMALGKPATALSLSSGPVPPAELPPSAAELLEDVRKSEKARRRLREQSGIHYLVFGKAKEKNLSELEINNLVTAETAEMKLIDLGEDEVLSHEFFKQGFFEIVAPDRIGGKFASIINRKLKQINKDRKNARKEKKRRPVY